MKFRPYLIIFLFVVFFSVFYAVPARAMLPLQGKVIVVDAGHGGYL